QTVRPGGRRAVAVAAHVVVENAEAALERFDRRVPHAHAAGERVAQHQPGRAFFAVQLVVDLDAVDLGLHVFSVFGGRIIHPLARFLPCGTKFTFTPTSPSSRASRGARSSRRSRPGLSTSTPTASP